MPENTEIAIKRQLSNQADVILDPIPIIENNILSLSPSDLKSLTNGQGSVWIAAQQLKQWDAGYKFGEAQQFLIEIRCHHSDIGWDLNSIPLAILSDLKSPDADQQSKSINRSS